MRIPCPHCGVRGTEEFAYLGQAGLTRPAAGGDWHAYVYERDNPAGVIEEFWYHQHGCGRWITVTRDTRTHAIAGKVP